jgi:hypothetical protein
VTQSATQRRPGMPDRSHGRPGGDWCGDVRTPDPGWCGGGEPPKPWCDTDRAPAKAGTEVGLLTVLAGLARALGRRSS